MASNKLKDLDMKQVARLAQMGWTDQQMADFFEIDRTTWWRWKGKSKAFCNTLKEWKEEADSRVERTLYERACGYSHPDVHISNYMGGITTTEITKHYPPDTASCIFWLKNRKPDDWKDKYEQAGGTDSEETIRTLCKAIQDITNIKEGAG